MIAKQHDSACEHFQASKFQFSIRKLFILHPSGERHKKKKHKGRKQLFYSVEAKHSCLTQYHLYSKHKYNSSVQIILLTL